MSKEDVLEIAPAMNSISCSACKVLAANFYSRPDRPFGRWACHSVDCIDAVYAYFGAVSGITESTGFPVDESGLAEERLERSLADAGATPTEIEEIGSVRTFDTGATRDTDDGKLDFEGFFAPSVMIRFAEFMHENRIQSDGELRDSDNWQKGIPRDQYMKSMFRHFMEVWGNHRSLALGKNDYADGVQETALCALMFNVMGYLFEMQQGR